MMKQMALATIDSALTILNIIADIESSGTSMSLKTEANPFDFLMDLFKSTVGYDKFLKMVSRFIVAGIPAMEYGVKTVLSSNIKNIISCNFNPIISDDMLTNGFTFNLKSIDLKGILNYCPIGKDKRDFGKYYYFGCDDFEITDDLIKSSDFDAVLWYAMNRAPGRVPWLGYKKQGEAQGKIELDVKQKKEDGIVTLEFLENGQSNLDPFNTQTPSNDMVRLFIGNTCRISDSNTIGQQIRNKQRDINDAETKILQYDELVKEIDGYIDSMKEMSKNPVVYGTAPFSIDLTALEGFKDAMVNGSSSLSDVYSSTTPQLWKQCITTGNPVSYYISSINETVFISQDLWNSSRQIQVESKISAQNAVDELANRSDNTAYRNPDKNYYYRRTVLEFNLDYIWSLQLFDAKVLTAQLIDALTGCLAIDLGLSVNQQVIKDEVNRMVDSILETDDTTVDDCFFRFSNDTYQAMYNAAEMRRMGLPVGAGVTAQPVYINAEDLLASLNEIDSGANEEHTLMVVENCITNVSDAMSKGASENAVELGFSANMNFLDKLLSNLANVIVSSIISPKLYMLIAINKRMLGENEDFSIEGFIESNKKMLVEIIRSIRDIILNYLKEELMKIIGTLVKQLAAKLSLEQFEYYRRLMIQCIASISKLNKNTDWDMADVNYADIIPEDYASSPPLSTC